MGNDKTKGHYNLILINEHNFDLDLIKNMENELFLKNNNIKSINLNNDKHNLTEIIKNNEINKYEKEDICFPKYDVFLDKYISEKEKTNLNESKCDEDSDYINFQISMNDNRNNISNDKEKLNLENSIEKINLILDDFEKSHLKIKEVIENNNLIEQNKLGQLKMIVNNIKFPN